MCEMNGIGFLDGMGLSEEEEEEEEAAVMTVNLCLWGVMAMRENLFDGRRLVGMEGER